MAELQADRCASPNDGSWPEVTTALMCGYRSLVVPIIGSGAGIVVGRLMMQKNRDTEWKGNINMKTSALLAFFGYLVVAVSVESPAASLEKPRQT